MEDLRDKLHKKGLNAWAKNNYKGTLLYGTGSGKTWCGIKAMNHFYKKDKNSKFLIVVPRIPLMSNWETEINKAKSSELLNNIEFICYASITKYKLKVYDLVILDEIHHCTSLKRMEFLIMNKSDRILGLTASLTYLQKYKLFKYAPVVDEYSLKEANKDGVVSDFEIYTIPVELTFEERLLYNALGKSADEYFDKSGKAGWKVIGKRTRLLHSAVNKIHMGVKLAELFKKEYGVIFSLSIDVSNEIAELVPNCLPLHSKLSKNKIKKNIELFSDENSPIKTLSTPTMLDEGITLPRLSYSIMLSRYSKERQTIQTVGRNVRKDDDPNKLAILVRVYCKNTAEEKWLRKSFSGFNVKNLNNYEEFENIIKEKRKNISQ